MKHDLCICEALSHTDGTMKAAFVSVTSVTLQKKKEQKTTFAHYQTFYTNSTEGTIHVGIW